MDAYCKVCGIEHTVGGNPQICANGHETYANPVPVAVLLQPVTDAAGRIGLLIGERGVEPSFGLMGLPGGFVDPGDADFEAAALRELREETGIALMREEAAPELFYSFSDSRYILVFVRSARVLTLDEVRARFVPCAECPVVDVAWAPMPLAFASHTEAARRWFENKLA